VLPPTRSRTDAHAQPRLSSERPRYDGFSLRLFQTISSHPASSTLVLSLPPKLLRLDAKHKPISVEELAVHLPASAWRNVTWREGAAAPLSSRFVRVRVRVAHRDYWLTEIRSEEWPLIEWPKGEKEPTKYWLSTLPEDISFRQLVDYAKLRWRIEHDYKELKQEVGLGDFEGRGWRGLHHHATLSIAGLWIPDFREGNFFPLRTCCQSSLPATCPSQGLPTPRLCRTA
jgi:hypothetical protein